MSDDKRLIISAPVDVLTAEDLAIVREHVREWESRPGSVLVLPAGWTYEIVDADIPVIVQG